METVLEKNKSMKNKETEAEVNLILECQKEERKGKVMLLDDSIKGFVNKRNVWKSIL